MSEVVAVDVTRARVAVCDVARRMPVLQSDALSEALRQTGVTEG